jgi:hypothetical protein
MVDSAIRAQETMASKLEYLTKKEKRTTQTIATLKDQIRQYDPDYCSDTDQEIGSDGDDGGNAYERVGADSDDDYETCESEDSSDQEEDGKMDDVQEQVAMQAEPIDEEQDDDDDDDDDDDEEDQEHDDHDEDGSNDGHDDGNDNGSGDANSSTDEHDDGNGRFEHDDTTSDDDNNDSDSEQHRSNSSHSNSNQRTSHCYAPLSTCSAHHRQHTMNPGSPAYGIERLPTITDWNQHVGKQLYVAQHNRAIDAMLAAAAAASIRIYC